MTSKHEIQHSIPREVGLTIRAETIKFFSGTSFSDTLSEVIHGDSLAQTMTLPSGIEREAIHRDMVVDDGWREEYWEIQSDGEVERRDRSAFSRLPGNRRFSHSDCLRRPLRDAYALRGLLSGLHSSDVLTAITSVIGRGPVSYMTADIARYRPGHYLRRHDDVYDGRIFGLVFFLHPKWESSAGSRLVAEKPDGRSMVVEPLSNTVAIMRLADDHFHQVEQNVSRSWDRYSIAVHFGLSNE